MINNVTVYSVLAAACAAVVGGGLIMIVVGFRGRLESDSPFRSRLTKVRAAGALTRENKRPWQIGGAAVLGALVWAASGWPVAGVLIAAGVLGIPYFFGAGRAAKRRIERLEALEEWTRRLADTMAAGVAPVPTLVASAERAPAPIAREVRLLANGLNTSRLDPRIALRTFADQIDDSLGDMITLALEIAVSAQISQNVPEVLRIMAVGVAEEVQARRVVEAERAGPRNEARMIVIVQIVFVIAVAALTTYTRIYGTFAGQVVLALLGGAVVLALFLLRKFSSGSESPRILVELEAR